MTDNIFKQDKSDPYLFSFCNLCGAYSLCADRDELPFIQRRHLYKDHRFRKNKAYKMDLNKTFRLMELEAAK